MRRLIMILFALMCAIGAKGQVDANGAYHVDWMDKVVKKNCCFQIPIAFYPEKNWACNYYVLYADTVSNKKINYTVYLYLFKDVETGKDNFLTKTGTIKELKKWAKKPYAKDKYGNSLFKTDKENYDIWCKKNAFGINYNVNNQEVVGLQL